MSRPNAVLLLSTLALTTMIAACSSDGGAEETDGGSQVEYLLCTEPAGSWTDLTDEDPNWRDGQPGVNWVDDSGCAIRLDHVWHRFGPEHCEWERMEQISFGLPVGTPYTGPDADPPGQDWDPSYVFNTDGVVENLPAGELIAAADVPATAVDTGLTTVTGRALFLAEDDSALYDVQGDTVRVFVRLADDEIGCA